MVKAVDENVKNTWKTKILTKRLKQSQKLDTNSWLFTHEMSLLSTWWLWKMIRLHLSIMWSPFIPPQPPVCTLQHATWQPYSMACSLIYSAYLWHGKNFLAGHLNVHDWTSMLSSIKLLIPVKSRYLLTSIMWPYCGLWFRPHWGHIPRYWFSAGLQPQDCYSWGRGVLTKAEFWGWINPWWVRIHKIWKRVDY